MFELIRLVKVFLVTVLLLLLIGLIIERQFWREEVQALAYMCGDAHAKLAQFRGEPKPIEKEGFSKESRSSVMRLLFSAPKKTSLKVYVEAYNNKVFKTSETESSK